MITGVHEPETGKIYVYGEETRIEDPNVARKLGIAAIYQHATAYQHLSVAENIFIGHEHMKGRLKQIDWKQNNQKAKELLDSLGGDIDPTVPMGNLSVAKQQLVEIAKALSCEAKILIMDEPTAALSEAESEELYRITENLRDKGVSIIFISHRFEDVERLADRITVFRDSKYIGTWNKGEISNDELVKHMVGREITQLFPKKEAKIGKELLRVEKLGRIGFFKDISFSLHEGEILGLTGLVGAGRTEVAQCIYGIDSFVIADFARVGRISIKPWRGSQYLALQRLTRHRMHITECIAREKTYMLNNIFLKFSEYALLRNGEHPFANKYGATAEAILTEYTTNEDIVNSSVEDLVALINSKSKGRIADPEETAKIVQAAARNSYRLDKCLYEPLTISIASSFNCISSFEKELKVIDKAILQTAQGLNPEEYTVLNSIPGIGKVYSAGILAELGFPLLKQNKINVSIYCF